MDTDTPTARVSPETALLLLLAVPGIVALRPDLLSGTATMEETSSVIAGVLWAALAARHMADRISRAQFLMGATAAFVLALLVGAALDPQTCALLR